MLEIAFEADPGSREPLYRQLSAYLRELIATRRLPAGSRLPASRDLARTLALGRNSITQAYQVLLDEGLLAARVGQGTYVSTIPQLNDGAVFAEVKERPFAWSGLRSQRNKRSTLSRHFISIPEEQIRFDLRPGRADSEALATPMLKRAMSDALTHLHRFANRMDPFGWLPLREQIAQRLVARGIQVDAEQVAIVSGTQQALHLIANALVDPGDAIAIEEPGYFGAHLAFTACEADCIPVPVDDQGLCTHELARLLRTRRIKLIYTTPAVQCPKGIQMSRERRHTLIELADQYQMPIIEDDYDVELRLGGPLAPALKAIDTSGHVLYLGTFSKVLFPGWRLGYLVAPPEFMSHLMLARWASDFGSDMLAQVALAEMIKRGDLEQHVRKLRARYQKRCSVFLKALQEELPSARITLPSGGNTIWVELPAQFNTERFHQAAADAGIAYARGELFYLETPKSNSILISYATCSEEQLCEAAKILGNVFRAQ